MALFALNPIDLDDAPMVLAAVFDLSSRRESERQKDQLRRELERSVPSLRMFANAASHDLKSPLRVFGHLAGWIRDDIQPSPGPKHRLGCDPHDAP